MTAPRDVLTALDAATLAAAVEGSRSWRQVLRKLGLQSHRHVRHLRGLCEQWSLPHEHLGHRAPPDDALREVLSTATSWAEAMTRLGFCEDSGSARSALRRHAARLGLDVRHLAVATVPAGGPLALQPDLRHLREAGSYLVAGAFVLAGYRVSWPLEPAPYDVVVDRGDGLLRVQVKTTSRKVAGSWNCAISRSVYADVAGGKRRARYSPAEIDAFGIVDGDGEVYVIPVQDVAGLASLSLRRYGHYRVPRPRPVVPETVERESG